MRYGWSLYEPVRNEMNCMFAPLKIENAASYSADGYTPRHSIESTDQLLMCGSPASIETDTVLCLDCEMLISAEFWPYHRCTEGIIREHQTRLCECALCLLCGKWMALEADQIVGDEEMCRCECGFELPLTETVTVLCAPCPYCSADVPRRAHRRHVLDHKR